MSEILKNLKDNSISFNDCLKTITLKDLEDDKVVVALINRFREYDCSEDYNLDKLEKKHEKLLSIIKSHNFDEEPLSKKFEKEESFDINLLDNIQMQDVVISLTMYDVDYETEYAGSISDKDAKIIETIIKDEESSLEDLIKCAYILREIDFVGDKREYELDFDNDLNDPEDEYVIARDKCFELKKEAYVSLLEKLEKTKFVEVEDVNDYKLEQEISSLTLDSNLSKLLYALEDLKEDGIEIKEDNKIHFGE